MPIPFDRFRLLNGSDRERKVVNYSSYEGEVQFDEQPVQVLPPGEMPVPPDVQEVGVRRKNEEDPPMEIGVVTTS